MPQELLYQERSITEIGRLSPDLWDFGRLPPPFRSIACASEDSPLIRYCSPFPFRATQPNSKGAQSFGTIYFEQDGLRRLARDRIDRS